MLPAKVSQVSMPLCLVVQHSIKSESPKRLGRKQVILTHNKQFSSGTLDTSSVDGATHVLVGVLAEHVVDGEEVVVTLAPDAVARTVGYLAGTWTDILEFSEVCCEKRPMIDKFVGSNLGVLLQNDKISKGTHSILRGAVLKMPIL